MRLTILCERLRCTDHLVFRRRRCRLLLTIIVQGDYCVPPIDPAYGILCERILLIFFY